MGLTITPTSSFHWRGPLPLPGWNAPWPCAAAGWVHPSPRTRFLNYDRLGIAEVHKHLAGGERDLHRWIEACGLTPAPQR